MSHPHTRTTGDSDVHFGITVDDPYRWLEQADDPEVAAWVRTQGSAARRYLNALPGREKLASELEQAIRLPHTSLPVHRGANWFRLTNDGDQVQDVVRVSGAPLGSGRVLIDPADFGPPDTTAVAATSPSPDGSLLAYAYVEQGSDWRSWRVRDVASGLDLADSIGWSKFSVPTWLPDGSGFVYGRWDALQDHRFSATNHGQRVMIHRLGTDQAEDELIFSPAEPDAVAWPQVTDDGRWLVLTIHNGSSPSARVSVRDLLEDTGELRTIVPSASASWLLIGSAGGELFMITDLDAPTGRVVALDACSGAVRELVPCRSDRLEGGAFAGGRLVLSWLADAAARVSVHELDGAWVQDAPLPELGTVLSIEGRPEDPVAYLGWTTFTEPDGVLALDIATGVVTSAFGTAFRTDVVVDRSWVLADDGERLPVFLMHRRDVDAANGPHPTWLLAYGGFDVSVTPTFDVARHTFARGGGVSVTACVRGGGEYGQAWHDAGRRANKQRAFDDSVAVAEHLTATGWTTPDRLGLSGRSNGGLLAGAVLTQRPDLFAAVVPEMGVLDMLRFPLWTIGWAWKSDYGDPHADREQFETLLAYSPLHNLRPDAGYPPVLIVTSDHDDRVVPAHSRKFAARLQAVSPPGATAVLRVEHAGGHREGRSLGAILGERVDVVAFLAYHTGLSFA